MDRTELKRQLDEARAETEATADKLYEQMEANVRLADGWTLEALAGEHVDQLRLLAKEYEVELTDEVIRGVWLASQLILDVDPEMMLGDG